MAATIASVQSKNNNNNNNNSENSNHEVNDIEIAVELLSEYTGDELVNELKEFPKEQWSLIIGRLPETAVNSFPACQYCINGTPHGGASSDPERHIRMMLSCRHGSIIAERRQVGRGRSRKNRRNKSRKQRYSRRR
jgi:hypothetical protein